MGADVHMFLEVEVAPRNKREKPHATYIGSYSIERNYELFGLLAGVRGEARPLYAPTGLPENVTHPILHKYTDIIIDDCSASSDGCISRTEAERFINTGMTTKFDAKRIVAVGNHTPSHLYRDQFQQVIDKYVSGVFCATDMYATAHVRVLQSILKMMETLETPYHKPRLVFFFDS
jgi:hypothetical protein